MSLKLDTKDRKIIKELEVNCRQSNTQIAKKVGLSKDAIIYRIKNLEKKGLIKGYYTVLNISKLGYLTYKIMISFRNTNKKTEQEIFSYLTKSPHVGWLVSCDGAYNLMAVLWVEGQSVFSEFWNNFNRKYGRFMKRREILIITENHSRKKSYLFSEKQIKQPNIFYGESPKIVPDKKNLEIIKILANNAKISLQEIASKTKLSGETIAYRIKKLQKKDILQAFRPIIDTRILGYEYYNVLIKLKNFDRVDEIFSFFNENKNIIYFVKYIGGYDIGIDLEVKNTEELRKVITEIKERFSDNIEEYISVLVYQENKLSYLPSIK